jgi:hypothetical protein
LLLTGDAVIKLQDDLSYFRCVKLPEVNADALCFFALSVIWRAAVRSWTIENIRLDRLQLGRHYEEAVRMYLLGHVAFPENVTLFACVSSLADVLQVCTFPESRKWPEYWSHFFSIPGITFTVNVGERMPDYLRLACLHCGDRPLFYTDLADLANARDFARLATLRE